MRIIDSRTISTPDIARFSWTGLKRFHNVPFVEDFIYKLHKLSPRDRANARKQAEQIRYCLLQAQEYFEAAGAASLATKPNLMYYSMMSLALAEILLKQDGMSSLDKARTEHRHHGLELAVAATPALARELAVTAAALRAKPIARADGSRMGTFELWHRSAREMPVSGKVTEHHHTGEASNTKFSTIFIADDVRLPLIPNAGLSLLDCMRALPGLEEVISTNAVTPRLIRGTLERVAHSDQSGHFRLIIHPGDDSLIGIFLDNFKMEADAVNRVQLVELPSGIIVTMPFDKTHGTIGFSVSPASMWAEQQIRFWPEVQPLNELGYIYVALYIAGNYARYYPDRWMVDVERSSPLSLAIEQLMIIAAQRMPLLALSEMTRLYHVPREPI